MPVGDTDLERLDGHFFEVVLGRGAVHLGPRCDLGNGRWFRSVGSRTEVTLGSGEVPCVQCGSGEFGECARERRCLVEGDLYSTLVRAEPPIGNPDLGFDGR